MLNGSAAAMIMLMVIVTAVIFINLIVVTARKILRNRPHLMVVADFEDNCHADFDMEVDMAMEQPESGIVGHKSDNRVSAVRHCDGILYRRAMQSPVYLA